jgi:SAM-dependent methyltransferase
MTGWGGGYITDITYLSGWYRQQSPAILALACLLNGAEATVPAGDDPVHVLELGCGQGYAALLLAASNPTWRITAIDFNPAHIAAARAWAAESRLENVTFLEADLATLAEGSAAHLIPEADFVTLHGLWTWVAPAVRDGIVRLLRDKVRPGGIVHVSYNVLPAWGPRMGMQRLIHDAGRLLAGRSDRQAEEGIKLAQSLLAAEAINLRQPASTGQILEQLATLPLAYLAHELMNDNWQPCYMADVAAAFAGAKLDWIGSSHLIENFPGLTLTGPQQAVQQRFDDPLMRELVKDMCIDRALRHDVYVRGIRRMTPTVRDATLMEVSLGMAIPADELPLEAAIPAGKVELSRAFYHPVARAMADGPRRVMDLLQAEQVEGRKDNPAELIGILVGLGFAEPAARPNAGPGAAAMRLNQVALRRMLRTENINRPVAAASLRMGTAVPLTLLELFVAEQARQGNSDAAYVGELIGAAANQGATIESVIQTRLPVLRAAGVL